MIKSFAVATILNRTVVSDSKNLVEMKVGVGIFDAVSEQEAKGKSMEESLLAHPEFSLTRMVVCEVKDIQQATELLSQAAEEVNRLRPLAEQADGLKFDTGALKERLEEARSSLHQKTVENQTLIQELELARLSIKALAASPRGVSNRKLSETNKFLENKCHSHREVLTLARQYISKAKIHMSRADTIILDMIDQELAKPIHTPGV